MAPDEHCLYVTGCRVESDIEPPEWHPDAPKRKVNQTMRDIRIVLIVGIVFAFLGYVVHVVAS